MKKYFKGHLFNRLEKIGNKKYNHVGCEGRDENFGNFLTQFVPRIGTRRKVKFTIETLDKVEDIKSD